MSENSHLDPALSLALAWQPAASRPALRALFELDAMLARTIRRAREPMLAQVRLAWWRERLGEAPRHWPNGEPVLAMLDRHWIGEATVLVPLIDGWEELLGDAPLAERAMNRFASGRGAALAAFVKLMDPDRAETGQVVGRRWALANLSSGSNELEERELALALGRAVPLPKVLPRALRGISVLDGLTHRALVRDEPTLAGRGAALLAMRLGVLGR